MKLNVTRLTRQLAEQIVQRTKSGKDKNLITFKPYSKAYAKYKKSNKVDLTDSGYMLSNLGAKNEDTIGFKSNIAQQRAVYNQGMGRQFMGLDKNQIDYIQKWIKEQTQRLLQKETRSWKFQ